MLKKDFLNFKKRNKLFYLLLPIFFGCSYHFSPTSMNRKIDIPFIEGDKRGILTNYLVYNLHQSLVKSNGSYILKGQVLKEDDEKIGFRQDRKKDGTLKKNLVPTEGRKNIQVRIIIEDREGKIVWGPKIFKSSADYDYVDQDSFSDLTVKNKEMTVLDFSLGQLESIDSAQEIAEEVTLRRLAQNIAQTILETW